MTITGEAAGVRFLAVPPATGSRRLVVVWHLMGEPGTPEAMAEALPLTGVDAWRLYAALPPWGEGPDQVVDGYAAMVESAVAAMPGLVAAAVERLGCDDGPVDLVGGSAGGHIALTTAARGVVPVRRVAVVNPAVRVQAVVEASIEVGAIESYDWTDASRAAVEPLDLLAQTPKLDVPLLVVRGEQEYPAFRPVQAELCAAVPGARLVDVPGLAHMLVTAQDVVDAEVTAWLA
ncbi:alpha/beta hydrolase family protein [Saccharothrix carnea]|uniref:Alpha/beta hydrolase family protein n=1 Tax=Saccharothrix carnea TaxID=1280637 RepID=A0A2P8IGM9_SACCR|nr:alpha/beta hydrolase fold domain-containing protein [Saccharothrix carnea]PSL57629.1 alpha/beta hydrolase family protein [Saccharothrix carnea]